VVGDCVEIFGADQHVQSLDMVRKVAKWLKSTYLNESVVQHEHNRSSIPSPSFPPEEHLSNITNITNLGVAKTKLPEDQGSVKNEQGDNNRQEDTWEKAKDGVRIRKRHNCQADVLGEKQRSCLARWSATFWLLQLLKKKKFQVDCFGPL